jgi:hypothetical protein
MKLEVMRFSSQKDDTLGLLFDVTDGRKFMCYTLEDEHRDVKVMHETRVPAGTYSLRLKTWGGFHDRYSNRFPQTHKGMIEVMDVPNFTHILLHCGNDSDDTSGCLLVGVTQTENVKSNGYVGSSTTAYRNIYPDIAEAIEAGGCTITYIDLDGRQEETERNGSREMAGKITTSCSGGSGKCTTRQGCSRCSKKTGR